jgi:hypothetical protein
MLQNKMAHLLLKTYISVMGQKFFEVFENPKMVSQLSVNFIEESVH